MVNKRGVLPPAASSKPPFSLDLRMWRVTPQSFESRKSGSHANPLAERLERLMNQLVNRAEADMVASVEASDASYTHSRWIVIGFALGSIALALLLGYAISWSVIGPVKEVDLRLKQIAAGDFSQHVEGSEPGRAGDPSG